MNDDSKLEALRSWAKICDLPSQSKYDCFEAGWDAATKKFMELLEQYGSDNTDASCAKA